MSSTYLQCIFVSVCAVSAYPVHIPHAVCRCCCLHLSLSLLLFLPLALWQINQLKSCYCRRCCCCCCCCRSCYCSQVTSWRLRLAHRMGQAGGETGEGEAQETFCWTGSKNLFGLLPGELIVRWQICMGKVLNSFGFLFSYLSQIFWGASRWLNDPTELKAAICEQLLSIYSAMIAVTMFV